MFTSDEGDGGGDVVDPSTWTIAAAQSTGGVAICFFLALVNMGEMTRLLQGSPRAGQGESARARGALEERKLATEEGELATKER